MLTVYYAVYTDHSDNYLHDDGSYYAVGEFRVSSKQAVRDGIIAKNEVPQIGGFKIHKMELDTKTLFKRLSDLGHFNQYQQHLNSILN